jgi:hypothetical protein
MLLSKILLIALALFIIIGGYHIIAYEKWAYEIRKEDKAMKKEAAHIGLEKARDADRKARNNPSLKVPAALP